jgi:elongator complex protein 6
MKSRVDEPGALAEHNAVLNPGTSTSLSQHLPSTDLSTVKSHLTAALSSLSIEPYSILVILDAPDFLIAANPSPTSTPPALQALLMDLRRHPSVHSMLVNISSSVAVPVHDHRDNVLPTDLDTAQKVLAVGLAHQADLVMQGRALDTGAAKDVTGFLRITTGGAVENDDGGRRERWKEGEVLYHVRNDGSVRVWERGEGVG